MPSTSEASASNSSPRLRHRRAQVRERALSHAVDSCARLFWPSPGGTLAASPMLSVSAARTKSDPSTARRFRHLRAGRPTARGVRGSRLPPSHRRSRQPVPRAQAKCWSPGSMGDVPKPQARASRMRAVDSDVRPRRASASAKDGAQGVTQHALSSRRLLQQLDVTSPLMLFEGQVDRTEVDGGRAVTAEGARDLQHDGKPAPCGGVEIAFEKPLNGLAGGLREVSAGSQLGRAGCPLSHRGEVAELTVTHPQLLVPKVREDRLSSLTAELDELVPARDSFVHVEGPSAETKCQQGPPQGHRIIQRARPWRRPAEPSPARGIGPDPQVQPQKGEDAKSPSVAVTGECPQRLFRECRELWIVSPRRVDPPGMNTIAHTASASASPSPRRRAIRCASASTSRPSALPVRTRPLPARIVTCKRRNPRRVVNTRSIASRARR